MFVKFFEFIDFKLILIFLQIILFVFLLFIFLLLILTLLSLSLTFSLFFSLLDPLITLSFGFIFGLSLVSSKTFEFFILFIIFILTSLFEDNLLFFILSINLSPLVVLLGIIFDLSLFLSTTILVICVFLGKLKKSKFSETALVKNPIKFLLFSKKFSCLPFFGISETRRVSE